VLKILDIMRFIVRKFALFSPLIEFLPSLKTPTSFYLPITVIRHLFFPILSTNFDKKRGTIAIKTCPLSPHANKTTARTAEKIAKHIDIRRHIFLLFIALLLYFINILQ